MKTTGIAMSGFLFFLVSVCLSSAFANALDDYIQKPDSSYSWTIEKTIEAKDYTAFIIHMHSQTWRTAAEVSAPLWQHTLTIVRPKPVTSDQALIYIGNGTSQEALPEQPDPKWVEMAKNTQSTVAELRNVPNQPLIYFNDGQERYEDNSVAYSWDKVMTTHDPTWNIRFPMVKSVVRAMDTVQAVMSSAQGGHLKINGFTVAGASKRGWATWLTAAVDKRVIAIIPMVIDVLNVQKFLKHHHSAYGFWSPAIKDYENHQILKRYESPAFTRLMEIEDPYVYRERIVIPKLLIHATGDQFFLPDSSQFYFHDLLGASYLRYLPNTDHSMKDSDAFQCMEAFYLSVIHKRPLPRFSWIKKQEGSIEVKVIDQPDRVQLWSAINPKARDFRLGTIGQAFSSVVLEDQGKGVYLAKVKVPELGGFAAFFVELTYSKNRRTPLKLTTEVSVLPDQLPFLNQKK